MPKELTHWAVAEKALITLDDNSTVKKIIHKNYNSYMAGAVIPDSPAHALYGNSKKKWPVLSDNFHNTERNSFEPIERVAALYGKNLSDSALALLLGIATHIFSDAAFHPFVYYFSGKETLVRHFRLETGIDVYFRQKNGGPQSLLFSDILEAVEMPEDDLAKILNLVFRTSSDAIAMLKAHAFWQSLYDKKWAKTISAFSGFMPSQWIEEKRNLFYPVTIPDRQTMFGHSHEYRHPVTGEMLSSSVDESFEKAVKSIHSIFRKVEVMLEKREMLAGFFSGLEGPNLLTGLLGTNQSQMKYFDTEQNIDEIIFS